MYSSCNTGSDVGSHELRTMSRGMRWLLLLMLVSLSRGRGCRESGNCMCREVSYWVWQVRCPSDSNPKFIASLNIDTGEHHVECHAATSWSEFEYRTTLPSYDGLTWHLTIERCPLPDKSFDHLTKRFSWKLPSDLTFTSHMNLSSNLTRRHLSMLFDVKLLNLSSNGLTELPSELFRDVGELIVLDLSFNEIAMLPSNIFHGLSKLWKLKLSHNAIKFFSWRLFDDCTNLRYLSLRGNFLTSLEGRTFRKMNLLYAIDLAENLLESLPPDALEYKTLLALDISNNTFSTLPEELFSRSELMKLTFVDNRGNLTTLPMHFLNNSTNLEEVILVRNNLTSLPENIFWCSFSMRTIDLHGNALFTLPKDIFKDSTALTFLDLSDNRLSYVTEGLFRALSKLRELNLASNSIASLPANIFENLYSLLELNLGFNKITNIQWTTFRTLPNMRLIRLSHNSVNLTELEYLRLGKYFYGSTIQKIFLDHNNLTGRFLLQKIDLEIPANLQFVDLSYNQISYVWVSSTLIGSHDVEYDLRHNNISSIEISDGISSKVNILVDDNPLYCGCKMYYSLKYMHKIREPQSGQDLQIILGNAACNEPHYITGRPVASLQFDIFACFPYDDYRHVWCAKECECWWVPHNRMRCVDCSFRNLRRMPEKIIEFVDENDSENNTVLDVWIDDRTQWFHWRNTGIILNFENNSLTVIPTLNGFGYEHVEFLFLSHNNISRLSFDVLPPRLQVLSLNDNDLKTLNATTVEAMTASASLRVLGLEKNPWNCHRETRNGLATLGEKFGKYFRYSFDTQTCLDSRQATSSGKTDRLYISFVRF